MNKVRLVEGTGPFANLWLRAIPTHPDLTLTDRQLRYGPDESYSNTCVRSHQHHNHVKGAVRRGQTCATWCVGITGNCECSDNALRDNLTRELR